MAIFFNTRKETHPDFRNTSAHGIMVGNTYWRSVEHYVQAQRFECTDLQAEVRDAVYAFKGKSLARECPQSLRNDWEIVRDEVMEIAVREKFKQHKQLRAALEATGEEEIIEASALSNYWGAGTTGTGKNKLGRILMKVRDELRNSFAQSHKVQERRLG